MVGIELVQNKTTKEPYPLKVRIGHHIAAAARKRGLLIRPLGNVIVLLPPLSTSQDVLAKMVDVLSDSLKTLPTNSASLERTLSHSERNSRKTT
jgi:adenosylmethionine-8-amino-7-oxononanoate aminotransferase